MARSAMSSSPERDAERKRGEGEETDLAQVTAEERPLDPVDEEHAALPQAHSLVEVGALQEKRQESARESLGGEEEEGGGERTYPPQVGGPQVAGERERPEVEDGSLREEREGGSACGSARRVDGRGEREREERRTLPCREKPESVSKRIPEEGRRRERRDARCRRASRGGCT